jgi:CheY-like chemotaxis protein
MNLSESIAPHLPFLRRYARALTGSQSTGDAYVRATLEAVLGKTDALGDGPPKLGLYRLFHVIWSGTVDKGDTQALKGSAPAPDDKLQALSPSRREALLLTSLEGFNRSEAAAILGKSQAAVEEDISQTQRSIEQQLASRVLIIEDEPIIALHLQDMMIELGHEVIGIAATQDGAIRQAHAQKPELVLADIRLAEGGSGIEAVSEILRSFDVPVIFITAYPERLLTGERPEPTYLITKPFLPETVKAAVSQALFFHVARNVAA